MEFIWFILIGLTAGWMADQLKAGAGFGIVGDVGVGVMDSLLGAFVFGSLILVATIRAVGLLSLLRMTKKAQ